VLATQSPGRWCGIVKWFNPDKGYGFIIPDSGEKDLFLHWTAVTPLGLSTLAEGLPVEYEIEIVGNKSSAVNLRIMLEDPRAALVEWQHGVVQWFRVDKGYGFIRPMSGGADVFVPLSTLERAGLQDLVEGQRVSYKNRRGSENSRWYVSQLSLD